ncbi:MAG: hypothetical protein AAEJ04_06110 [Planctomycetota bacterium]
MFRLQQEPPEYIVMDGYPERFQAALASGIDEARSFFGNYGPVRVYVFSEPGDDEASRDALQEVAEDYCRARRETALPGFEEDCLGGPAKRLVDVAASGGEEAFLSAVIFTDPPFAELVFINADGWGVSDLPIRGIHEYTHVFQQAHRESPGWLMEGGAVFFEAWLGSERGWVDFPRAMKWSMQSAQTGRSAGRGLKDMEYTRDLPTEMEPFHRSIAYDMGVWAVTFMIARSESGSIEDYRDKFYPLLQEYGWRLAVAKYTRTDDIAEFYQLFEKFLAKPLQEQMEILETIKR